MVLVMLNIALKLLIIFWLKKPSFCLANSVCYLFYGEEAADLNQMLVCHLLWCYRQINGIHVGKNLDLQLLLLLSSDIELCPRPEDGYFLNDNLELRCLIKQRGLKCLHLNVQGLWNNLSHVMELLATYSNVNFFAFSKTHIQDEPEELYSVSGYSFII